MEKAELFNRFFVGKCQLNEINAYLPNELELKTHSTLSYISVTLNEVTDSLLKLEVTKAYGPDFISPRLLKEGAHQLAPSLTSLFNYSLNTCQIPVIWKTANVVPILKKGDWQEVSNYRPVSLLSAVSKCFEKIIFKHVYNYFRDNSILSKCQSGFIPGDSTINQLIGMYHLFAQALDNKQFVQCIFCDISAAFDCVWHRGLIYKLECVGITGQLLLWFKDYLSDRSQRVVLQGQSSTKQSIKAGVPQGSVLGPLLFLVFINDLPDIVHCHIRLFADDMTFFTMGDNIEEASVILNDDLSAISQWAKKWLVTFNPSKTKSVHFSYKESEHLPDLFFHGTKICENKISQTFRSHIFLRS